MRKHLIESSSILLVILFSLSFGQVERRYYEVTDYSGGINVQSDTGSLASNQALILDNLVFDRYGSLQKRYGYKYWNNQLLPSGDTILDLHYLYRSKGSDQLLIGTNNYIYASLFGDTITSAANWVNQRIGYSRGVVDMEKDSNLVFGDTTWWLLAIKTGDLLKVADSTYTIDSILADTCIRISREWVKNDTDNIAYEIVRTIVGTPYITSWNSNAYIADDQSSGFYYADSQVYWLNCVDSGTVDEVLVEGVSKLDTTSQIYSYWTAVWPNIYNVSRTLEISSDIIYDSVCVLIDSGYIVKIRHNQPHSTNYGIRTVESCLGNNLVWMDYGDAHHNTRWLDEEARIWHEGIDTGEVTAIVDSSKAWEVDEHAGNLIVRGDSASVYYPIIINEYDRFDISDDGYHDTVFVAGDRYYIYETIPYMELSDTVESPHYKQFEFYKNTLYAYGYELDKYADTINTGFIYHSDIGLPKRWISFEGFDLSLNNQDKPTSMFNLNDNLIITTNDKIYNLSGYPPALGNGALVEVISGTGIKNYNAVIRRDNNYAYLARKDGLFIFNGNSVNKISGYIDPLINSYRSTGKTNSYEDMELGYYDDNVYFSFPAAQQTFVYHEPTKTFTKFKFGIKVFNNQATLIDSTYFIFSEPTISPRRIYKYPTSLYIDSLSSTTSDTIDIRYKTGRFNLGDIKWEKLIDEFWITCTKRTSNDTLYTYFRTNYDTTATHTINISSAVSAASAYRVAEHYALPLLKGRYFQVEFYANTTGHLAIEKWGLGWLPNSKF